MTSFPAQILGLSDRGVVAAGMLADLIIFDVENVHERASYPEPLQLAQGFDVVIVNGKIARENGRLDPSLHGRVLQPGQ
jgi:N-acyl-D-aspartate/D-glutamate deacylase